MSYAKQIEKGRKEKDKFYKESPHSPLTGEQIEEFKELDYFPVDNKYRFEVELKEYNEQEEIHINTTKNLPRSYIRYGYVEFEINGLKQILIVYRPIKYPYHLFLGFRDATTGKESYKDGRYIELEKKSKNTYILDFNLAYNPYCAYNDHWDCLIIPSENNLKIEIKAGEKKFH